MSEELEIAVSTGRSITADEVLKRIEALEKRVERLELKTFGLPPNVRVANPNST